MARKKKETKVESYEEIPYINPGQYELFKDGQRKSSGKFWTKVDDEYVYLVCGRTKFKEEKFKTFEDMGKAVHDIRYK